MDPIGLIILGGAYMAWFAYGLWQIGKAHRSCKSHNARVVQALVGYLPVTSTHTSLSPLGESAYGPTHLTERRNDIN